MASNTAAWITAPKAHPFEVKPAPLWTPSENEILIQNHALGMHSPLRMPGLNVTKVVHSLDMSWKVDDSREMF